MNILKRFSHPNVVNYVDSYQQDSKFCLIMEYCEKGDLGEYLARLGSQFIV